MTDGPNVTRQIAAYLHSRSEWPAEVEEAGVRSFVNILGCAFGGAHHPATLTALDAASEFAGAPTTTLIGHPRRTDGLTAAFINGLAASAHAFDDTHLATVIHPAGPVAAALWSLCERQPVSGRAFLDALIVGIEVECRLGTALLSPPAEPQLAWYATGITGGIGAAGACARVLGLTEEQTRWALALAANQASGFRQTHGSMCTSFVPAHAGRAGLQAALLAAKGFTGSDAALEGTNGYFDVFSLRAHAQTATADLGRRFEIIHNAFKPYPCGIVIHPVLDACLAIADRGIDVNTIERVDVTVNPLCLTLCDRPAPEDSQRAQVSVQHWAAASLVRASAGLAEGAEECVQDEKVRAIRDRVVAVSDLKLGRDEAKVSITFAGGKVESAHITDCVGSINNPMTREQLHEKFIAQAGLHLDSASATQLAQMAWAIGEVEDVAALLRRCSVAG